ncbi:MAG TPA: hypothetical protein VFB66_22045, partial [Tepidisphaeraceae bacterium]|nr:hypothetical protein [Tepidisphaeraceae bacterium]
EATGPVWAEVEESGTLLTPEKVLIESTFDPLRSRKRPPRRRGSREQRGARTIAVATGPSQFDAAVGADATAAAIFTRA